jgi:hypothetical protein
VTASERLTASLADLETAGESWPCRGRDEWISEDHHERAAATELCAGCPVFDLCAAMAAETNTKFGVYAGTDLTPTPKRKAA